MILQYLKTKQNLSVSLPYVLLRIYNNSNHRKASQTAATLIRTHTRKCFQSTCCCFDVWVHLLIFPDLAPGWIIAKSQNCSACVKMTTDYVCCFDVIFNRYLQVCQRHFIHLKIVKNVHLSLDIAHRPFVYHCICRLLCDSLSNLGVWS